MKYDIYSECELKFTKRKSAETSLITAVSQLTIFVLFLHMEMFCTQKFRSLF